MTSPYDDSRNHSIAVNVGVNAAVELATSQGDVEPLAYFLNSVEQVCRAVLEVHDNLNPTKDVIEQVQKAFPGTSVVPETPVLAGPTATVVPFPGITAAQVPPPFTAAPAPIPGVSTGTDPQLEANWQSFFQACQSQQLAPDFKSARDGQWFDNRAGKSPKAPDFKVKGPKGADVPSLWIDDKKIPDWVRPGLQRLGLIG